MLNAFTRCEKTLVRLLLRGTRERSSSASLNPLSHKLENMKTAFTLFVASALTASAVTLTVLPTDPSWVSPPGENTGGGSSAITGTAPRSGNGSVEMRGDRTRYVGLGNFYSPASNLGLLSSVTDFKFDWMVAPGSIGTGPGAAPSYSPALRLHIWDGAQRSELIWENAYNGSAPVVQGTWYTSGSDDNFWRFQTGIGDSLIYDRSIADWSSLGYSSSAYIAGISVGAGGSAGPGYHAFADNVTLTFGTSATTYNFETASVPDGGTTLVLLGGALTGLGVLRRKFRA